MMKPSSSYASVSAEPNPLHCPDEHEEGCLQSVSGPSTCCIQAAGVLRYNRESENYRLNLTTTLSQDQPPAEYAAECEFCGEKARPPLHLTWIQVPEFCCAQRQQLGQMLLKQRFWLEGRRDLTTELDKSVKEEKLLLQGREMEDHNKFIKDLPITQGIQSDLKVYNDQTVLPETETYLHIYFFNICCLVSPPSKGLSFRLSYPPGKESCLVSCSSTTEKCLKIKEEQEEVLVPYCDHNPTQFGLCHHQGAGFLQKYYPSGKTFLTVFPDGSAQVFYPSGTLALVVAVPERNGRVCVVLDDGSAPSQPVRAVFQSDGRAVCYHSNGNMWLVLNRSGGQCLSDAGARTYQWSWGSASLTRTLFHPVFLSLNKAVGVRVLGNKKVFVSFLAKGQQAKFNVGSCCTLGEHKTPEWGSSLPKEELQVLAAKIRIHTTLQHLQQCLRTPFQPRVPKSTLTPQLRAAAWRLLHSAGVTLTTSDREFIHRHLKDC
ncbi:uncharacterized protein [Leuresthes tenuis]|uniref:uncharacterized protein n=1 Tax=Leuresthes tenuis TaxID=355514 RepID=UPI003B510CAB